MQEPKLISPLLDDFNVGSPIKDANGIRCCPAMRKESDDKYIVKIISTPASQKQLDALLLTGAYSSTDDALGYFKSLSESIIDEVHTLQKLSQLEGFLPIVDCQMVAMDNAVGYDVYLLSEYRKTLSQQYRHGAMTHLSALNLGLDLCSALSVCRRMGYLYVNLKPDNIYYTAENVCRIGDIGFMRLDGLKYASLPERYRSAYTAPEIADAFSSINTTVDIYALGLILYQAFNNGQLPVISADAAFPAPDYADYEMAEIILKACNPDPEKRWQDPIEMGQALVSYMQRNGAHDTPIVPLIKTPDVAENAADDESDSQAPDADVTETPIDTGEMTAEAIIEVDNLNADEEMTVDNADASPVQYEENADGSLQFSLDLEYDETVPEQMEDDVDYNEVSAEVSDMLSQADELIQHPTPDPVIPPEPIDVPMPPPIEIIEESEELPSSDDTSNEEPADDIDEEIIPDELDADPDLLDYDEEYIDEPEPKKKKRWIPVVISAVVCALIAAAGIWFYTNIYLQNIDSISLRMKDNGDITVIISSQIDETKLSVLCSDVHGNQLTQPVKDGMASFTKLTPGSAYKIQIAIDGFHQLTGTTTASFNTPAQTNILQLQAATGNEDGSVVISFAIDGPDSKKWQLQYTSADGHEQTVGFAGHLYTIPGLSVGTEYTFTLTPETNINYIGTNTITYVASNVITAENVQVMGWINDALTVKWQVPENISAEGWSVRCYNDTGYDQTINVTEPIVSFTGTDNSNAYTIEVVAAGQSASVRADIPANSYTVLDFQVDDTKANTLVVSWNDNGIKPADGWYLVYSADGSQSQKIQCPDNNTVEIANPIPDAKYIFSLQTAEGTPVLGGQCTHAAQKAAVFSGYGVTADMMDFKMCKRPSKKDWSRSDLAESDYTASFKSGTKAAFLVHLKHSYKVSGDKITTLFVIRDENGAVISAESTTNTWKKMWYRSYCELDIPSIPEVAGNYNISIYFNGAFAHQQSFTVK